MDLFWVFLPFFLCFWSQQNKIHWFWLTLRLVWFQHDDAWDWKELKTLFEYILCLKKKEICVGCCVYCQCFNTLKFRIEIERKRGHSRAFALSFESGSARKGNERRGWREYDENKLTWRGSFSTSSFSFILSLSLSLLFGPHARSRFLSSRSYESFSFSFVFTNYGDFFFVWIIPCSSLHSSRRCCLFKTSRRCRVAADGTCLVISAARPTPIKKIELL